MIEVRLGLDGWIAQLMPVETISPASQAEGRRWLCMSWPNGTLHAELLTDDDVADWQVVYHDESPRTDPQRADSMAPLSQDFAPDKPKETGATRG